MCRLLKYRKQDRIAREIAAKFNMVDDYRLARRQGLSPLEALEDFDLIKPEERERFK